MIVNSELQERMAEQMEFALSQTPEALAAENAELRELVRELYEDQCADGDEWKYRDRLSELGVEVDG